MVAKNNDRKLQNSESNTHFVEDVSQDHVLRRSIHEKISHCCFEIDGKSFMCALFEDDEPVSFREALVSPNGNEWMSAMRDEMNSMKKNQVWQLIGFRLGN